MSDIGIPEHIPVTVAEGASGVADFTKLMAGVFIQNRGPSAVNVKFDGTPDGTVAAGNIYLFPLGGSMNFPTNVSFSKIGVFCLADGKGGAIVDVVALNTNVGG